MLNSLAPTLENVEERKGITGAYLALQNAYRKIAALLNYKTPLIVTGSGSPTTAPNKIGDIYVDTLTPNVYVSKGTTDVSDWIVP